MKRSEQTELVPKRDRVERRLSLRQFRALVAIADYGGITQAAERLNLTQSAISKAISEIEYAFGVPMVQRHGRRITLAPAGFQVAASARRIGVEVRVLLDNIDLIRHGAVGRVQIGMKAMNSRMLAKAITEFKAAWPRVNVIVQEGPPTELLRDLRSGKCDFLYGRMQFNQRESDLEGIGFEVSPTAVTASVGHPALETKPLSWEEAVRYAWCVPTKGVPMRDHFDDHLKASGLPQPTDMVESSAAPFTMQMLEEMNCLGLLPVSFAEEMAKRDVLAVTNLRLPTLIDKTGLIWSKELQLGRAARALRVAFANCLELELGRPVLRPWLDAEAE